MIHDPTPFVRSWHPRTGRKSPLTRVIWGGVTLTGIMLFWGVILLCAR